MRYYRNNIPRALLRRNESKSFLDIKVYNLPLSQCSTDVTTSPVFLCTFNLPSFASEIFSPRVATNLQDVVADPQHWKLKPCAVLVEFSFIP